MSTALRLRGSIDRLAARYGGGDTATLRRPLTLTSRSTGALLTSLALVGTHASGETELDLDAASVVGTIPSGITLTVAGVSGTYTTDGDSTASGNAVTVTITSGLASEGADDAAVTLTSDNVEYSMPGAEYSAAAGYLDRGSEESGERRLMLSLSGLSVVPEIGDHLVWQSDAHKVTRVHLTRVGGTVVGAMVTLGGID